MLRKIKSGTKALQYNFRYSKNEGGRFLKNQKIKINYYDYQSFVKYISKIYTFVG